jgi:hypothetical protein
MHHDVLASRMRFVDTKGNISALSEDVKMHIQYRNAVKN